MGNRSSRNKLLVNAAKVGLCGATIVGIMWAFVSLSSKGEVKESEALIWDMRTFERSNTQKFASALKDLGHEPPRVYNWNGNETYFSVRKTDKSPEQVLFEYQEELVEKGVNERSYTTVPNVQFRGAGAEALSDDRLIEQSKAMLSGQIVPYTLSENYLGMGGGLIDGAPETIDEFDKQMKVFSQEIRHRQIDELEEVVDQCGGLEELEELTFKETKKMKHVKFKNPKTGECPEQDVPTKRPILNGNERKKADSMVKRMTLINGVLDNKEHFKSCPAFRTYLTEMVQKEKRRFPKMFKSFRSIEAFRSKSNGKTTVSAVWGDKGFDVNKAMRDSPVAKPIEDDPSVPTCPNCEHRIRFSGTQASEPYVTNMYSSQSSSGRLQKYYEQELAKKGWKRAESNKVLHQMFNYVDGMPREAKEFYSYARGNQHLTVMYQNLPGERGTFVTTMQSP